MVEILSQAPPKYLRFVSQDISMVFIVKVAHNIQIVKVAQLTNIYGGNPKFGLERGLKLLYIYLIRYIQDSYCENRLVWRS